MVRRRYLLGIYSNKNITLDDAFVVVYGYLGDDLGGHFVRLKSPKHGL